jgi:nucleotide-binding universal stress UspA family protein
VKILVGYDGSEEAKHALDWAVRLCQALTDGSISVIAVAPSIEAAPHTREAVDPTSDIPVHEAHLEDAAARLTGAGVQAEMILRVGRPAEEILDTAEEGDYDMIVLGHRGMGAARRFLMGSVSERVVRHATRPVLVVP